MWNLFQSFFGGGRTAERYAGPCGPGRPSRQTPPASPGYYYLSDKKSGQHDYCGQSDNLARRAHQHERSGKYRPETHFFEWKAARPRATNDEIRQHEKQKISKHEPRMNRNGGGGGRRPRDWDV